MEENRNKRHLVNLCTYQILCIDPCFFSSNYLVFIDQMSSELLHSLHTRTPLNATPPPLHFNRP